MYRALIIRKESAFQYCRHVSLLPVFFILVAVDLVAGDGHRVLVVSSSRSSPRAVCIIAVFTF